MTNTSISLDRLSSLEMAIKMAKSLGFESTSSPIDILLEAGIDVFLLLKDLFFEGQLERKKNPELIFSKSRVDVLNNPLQLRISEFRKWQWDEDLAKVFSRLATWLVLVKTKDRKKYLPFMGRILSLGKEPVLPQKVGKKETSVQEKSPGLSRAERAYFRRQQQKKRKE